VINPSNVRLQDKRINRIFKGSLFEEDARCNEHQDFVIDLSTDCKTEKTMLDFLTTLGLSLHYNGTEYLMCIITTSVNSLCFPRKPGDFYKIAAKKYNISLKIVEMAAMRAVETMTTDRIRRVNQIFGCDVIEKDGLCAGTFLSAVCARFIMLKSHAMGKTFFAGN